MKLITLLHIHVSPVPGFLSIVLLIVHASQLYNTSHTHIFILIFLYCIGTFPNALIASPILHLISQTEDDKKWLTRFVLMSKIFKGNLTFFLYIMAVRSVLVNFIHHLFVIRLVHPFQ